MEKFLSVAIQSRKRPLVFSVIGFVTTTSAVVTAVVLFILMNVLGSMAWGAVTATELNDPVEQYDTFELRLDAPDVSSSKFSQFPSVTFTENGNDTVVEGFFNGDGQGSSSGQQWLVRFMPKETGTYTYSWSFDGENGSGSITVTNNTNSLRHGHVYRDGKFLRTDDGHGFYYVGANWQGQLNLRPDSGFQGFSGCGTQCAYFSNSDYIDYLNLLRDTNHNGTWMADGQAYFNNDRTSFNLEWAERLDLAVEQAGERGLYYFMGLMNYFGPSNNNPFQGETDSDDQLLDPFDDSTFVTATELFLRYTIARYAGYYNTMWELGNEMDHSGACESCFRNAANNTYVPFMRSKDPYDLMITVSEDGISDDITGIDIDGHHQNESFPFSSRSRPGILTEIVNNVSGVPKWRTDSCQDEGKNENYRADQWEFFMDGGSGAIECSIMFNPSGTVDSLQEFINDRGILDKMEQHGHLHTFIQGLPLEVHEIEPLSDSVISSSEIGTYGVRGDAGVLYTAFFNGNTGSNGNTITLNLQSGNYIARWFSPEQGIYSSDIPVVDDSTITSPWNNEEHVAIELRVTGSAGTTPPLPPTNITIGPR